MAAVSFDVFCGEIENAEYESEKLLIDREILKRLQIEKGSELTLDEIKDLVFVSQCYRAKNKAVWYLSQSDLSKKALYDKLLRTYSQKASAFAVEQMLKKGYLNDERYAENLAHRLFSQNVSVKAAVGKMLAKGVDLDLAKKAVAEYKDDNYLSAYRLLITKYKNKLSNEDDVRRTVQALLRRGFSYTDVKSALEKVKSSADE